jgi:hypothetical protein
VVCGAVTAFAASLNVNGTSLGAGNATVTACNTSASVNYTTTPSGGTYKVAAAPITSAVGCATMSYRVTLLGSSNSVLAEQTGTLDSTGAAAPDFSGSSVSASAVTGVALVITG